MTMNKLQEIKQDVIKMVIGDRIAIPQGSFDYLFETIDQLQQENERYKDINQGLLEVQFSLRDKEKEYQQWFKESSQNVRSKDEIIEQLEKDVEFFKNRKLINNQITQELVALDDDRIEEILTKTRII